MGECEVGDEQVDGAEGEMEGNQFGQRRDDGEFAMDVWEGEKNGLRRGDRVRERKRKWAE